MLLVINMSQVYLNCRYYVSTWHESNEKILDISLSSNANGHYHCSNRNFNTVQNSLVVCYMKTLGVYVYNIQIFKLG